MVVNVRPPDTSKDTHKRNPINALTVGKASLSKEFRKGRMFLRRQYKEVSSQKTQLTAQ